MKRLVICFLFVVVACDEEPKSTPTPVEPPPTKKEVAKEVAQGVADEIADRGPKWKVDYTGDLSGSVQGGVLTAMAVGTSASATGRAMRSDKKGSAPQRFLATFMPSKDKPDRPVTFGMTLADGTECKQNTRDGLSRGTILDKEKKTFKAEISGKLVCGDKHITYTATLSKKP